LLSPSGDIRSGAVRVNLPEQREQSTCTTTAKSPLRVNRTSAAPEPDTLVDFVFVTLPAVTFFNAGAVEGLGDGLAVAEEVVVGVGLAGADAAGAVGEGADDEGAGAADALAEGASGPVVEVSALHPGTATTPSTTKAASSARHRGLEVDGGRQKRDAVTSEPFHTCTPPLVVSAACR
jgi:hypothetical protein